MTIVEPSIICSAFPNFHQLVEIIENQNHYLDENDSYMFHHDVSHQEVYRYHVYVEENLTTLPVLLYTIHYTINDQLYHDA